MKDYLCKECGETNSDNFYSSKGKSKCKKCILAKRKEDRKTNVSKKKIKEYLCAKCGETNVDNFYKTTSKSKCKKCILDEKKNAREIEKEEEPVVDDTDYVSREDFERMNETLRLHIDTLDNREAFDNPDGSMTFREILDAKIDEIDKLNTDVSKLNDEIDEVNDRLNDTIAYYEEEIGNMRTEMNELRKMIRELGSLVTKTEMRSTRLTGPFKPVY